MAPTHNYTITHFGFQILHPWRIKTALRPVADFSWENCNYEFTAQLRKLSVNFLYFSREIKQVGEPVMAWYNVVCENNNF